MNSSWHNDSHIANSKALNSQNPVLAAFRYNQPVRKAARRKSQSSNDDGLIQEIRSFSDNLRTSLVPQFDSLETKLNESIEGFKKQLDSFDAVQTKTHNVVELFKQQVLSTQAEFESHLAKLDEWGKKDRNIHELETRLAAARDKLKVYKERLEKVTDDIRTSDEMEEKRVEQSRIMNNTLISITVALIAIVWYYLWGKKIPMFN